MLGSFLALLLVCLPCQNAVKSGDCGVVAGGCLITGFDQFQSANIISRQQHLQSQPVYNTFDNSAGQISSDQEATSDVHEVGTRQPPTKKRLSSEQVKLLESSFDIDSKLEPDRKNQLANDLGLQPRQVAVWYQNKRARSKAKQLEQKYVVLKEEFQVILAEKQQLERQVLKLRELLGLQEDKSPESTVVTPPVGKEDPEPVSAENHEQAATVETRSPFLKEQEQPIKEADEEEDEDEGEPEETAVETEAESVELSCSGTPCSGTGVSEALDSISPPSNRCDLSENTSGLTQSMPSFVVQPSFSFDQVLLFNQQQHQMLHQLHHHNWTNFHQLGSVKLELDESAYLTKVSASEGDQLYSNFLLSLQDESASLDFEFVT